MQPEKMGQPVHEAPVTAPQGGREGSASVFADDSRGSNLLAIVALGGSGCFVASAMLLPAVSEYGIRRDFISELAIGRYGFVQMLAFVAFGIGALALAMGLRKTTKGSWGSLVGSILVGLFGVGVLLDAVFPIDPGGRMETIAGTVHLVAALVAFACMVLAMFVFSRTFKQSARWRSLRSVSLVLAVAALAALFLPGDGGWAGLFQRVFVGVVISWMVIVAIRLRSM
jgi:hypothetical protein